MNTALILDIIFAAALILSVLIGAKRGLFKSLMSLVVIIAALIGASMLSNMFTEPVTDFVMPKVEQKVDSWLAFPKVSSSEFLSGLTSSDANAADKSSGIMEKLEQFGAGSAFLDSVQKATDKATDAVEDAVTDAATAAARAVVKTIVHAVLFVIFYLVLVVALKLVTKLLDAALDKIPVVNKVNSIGGAVIGFAECVLILFMVCYLAPRLGVKVYSENVDQTFIVSFFANHSPSSLIAMLNH